MRGPKKPRLVMQGNLVLAVDISSAGGNPDPPLRGDIKGFSKASRRRMIEQCAKMGKAIPIFVTLTYPGEYPDDPAEWKRHLATWGKRLVRYDKSLSAIWRLEPQKRGAPHYHLLIYSEDGKKPFVPKEWIAESWSKVLGDYSSEDHLKAGTRVESLKSYRGAAFYTAKYCAKLPEDGDFPESWDRAGRLWGSFNKKCLPLAKQHEMFLHSELEQGAVLFAMKDAYRGSFVEKKVKEYTKEGMDIHEATVSAEEDWDLMVKENEHFGNTTKAFCNGEKFLEVISAKIGFMEMKIAERLNRPANFDAVTDFVDRKALVF